MFALLPLVLSAGLATAPQDEGVVLHEPKSGATLTLPQDWTFVKGEEGLTTVSEDERGFVLLVGSDTEFEALREDVKALILTRLDDVVVTRTTVKGVDERGVIEEMVEAHGKGVSKLDGATVSFAGILVRSGERGALVLGAWKDEANARVVAGILGSLAVKKSAGETGLEITNAATGASITIPAGWEVLRTRKGLLASCPHGNAMAIVMTWQKDFERSLEKIRGVLLGWVFADVKIGDFAVVEASYHESLGRVVAANGTAVDRIDGKPASFKALRLQRVDQDEGAVLFGVWKDEVHAEEVASLMASIKIEEGED